MPIIISQKIRDKLKSKHSVSEEDVAQCFANRTGTYLLDPREEHASDPPTQWFISETDFGRKLKVVFILKSGNIFCVPLLSQTRKKLVYTARQISKISISALS